MDVCMRRITKSCIIYVVCMCLIEFAFVYISHSTLSTKQQSWEQYGNDVALAAFEWLDIFDPDYRHSTWIGGEEWITDVTHLVLDKWTSQWLSSCGGGRSSVLLMFEYMWWKDMSFTEGWASPPCLNCVGWQDMSLTVVRKIERPPLILTVLVVGQELISIIIPGRPPLILTV